jgi:hypothetical protein
MVANNISTNCLFEILGVFSGIKTQHPLWIDYENFAKQKIKESIVVLRGAIFYAKELTDAEARKEVQVVASSLSFFHNFRTLLESDSIKTSTEFKVAALELISIVDELLTCLREITEVTPSYEYSLPVLSVDWECKEDDHWNNY